MSHDGETPESAELAMMRARMKSLPGPWNDEPDREEWRAYGLPCLVLRGPFGQWCGYVAVPPGHPWYGNRDPDGVDVHGGVTYAGRCRGHICHVPRPGESDDVFWLGFDCGHAGDLMPSMEALRLEIGESPRPSEFWQDKYRDLAYVKEQCEYLAEQVLRAAR